MSELPQYPSETLCALSTDELVEILVRDEDRVPRNVIDECARRGDGMLDRLADILENGPGWKDEATTGEWWLLLHAVMMLGLMPGSRAGMLLLGFMRKIAGTGDDTLDDWLAGHWPALFRNKPAEVIDTLRAAASDRELDWYARSSAQEPVLAFAAKTGTLDGELAWIARIAADESEDWALRMLSATRLIDFPRETHRALLLDLAQRQKSKERMFDAREVERAYAKGVDRPEWAGRGNPWAFYHPEEIAERQRRWTEEDEEGSDDFDELVEPYVRDGPKIGRNDPCPCGSGKKYKRCCMPA